MNSIIYILDYYHINYHIDRNDVGDYFLDLCKLANHHMLVADINDEICINENSCLFSYLNHALSCKYKL